MTNSESTSDTAPEIRGDNGDQMSQDVWCALYMARLGPDTVPHLVAKAADADMAVLRERGLVAVAHRVAVLRSGTT